MTQRVGAKRVAVSTVAHTMDRLDISTRQPFEVFLAAFRAAVPDLDVARVRDIVEGGGTWEDVQAAVAVAGHKRPAIEYLMGNHTIAERVLRHHPDAALYAPLRVLIYADDAGDAVFALDQPSTVFAGLGVPEVAAVGRELDEKVTELLTLLNVPVPSGLTDYRRGV